MSGENASKVSEEMVNQRQQYKKEKLEESTQIFYCECGKNYLTFSALYLHARNKHNVKLTTKRNSSNCRVQTKGNKTYVTYFTLQETLPSSVQNQQQKKHSHSNQKSKINNLQSQQHRALLRLFLNQQNQTLSEEEAQVITNFRNYFQTLLAQKVGQYYDPRADIVLFFNEFAVYYYPQYVARGDRTAFSSILVEQTLMKLYHWLREQNMIKCQIAYTKEKPRRFPF